MDNRKVVRALQYSVSIGLTADIDPYGFEPPMWNLAQRWPQRTSQRIGRTANPIQKQGSRKPVHEGGLVFEACIAKSCPKRETVTLVTIRMRPGVEAVSKFMIASKPLNMQAAARSRHELMSPLGYGWARGMGVTASVTRGDPHAAQNRAAAMGDD